MHMIIFSDLVDTDTKSFKTMKIHFYLLWDLDWI